MYTFLVQVSCNRLIRTCAIAPVFCIILAKYPFRLEVHIDFERSSKKPSKSILVHLQRMLYGRNTLSDLNSIFTFKGCFTALSSFDFVHLQHNSNLQTFSLPHSPTFHFGGHIIWIYLRILSAPRVPAMNKMISIRYITTVNTLTVPNQDPTSTHATRHITLRR